jgi:SAM-dependent methyltransferase
MHPGTTPRFDPAYITEEDLEDLSTFTGMSRNACLERVRGYSMAELAAAWEKVSPRSEQEFLAFYRSTDLYVWELSQWHASPARRPYWAALSFVSDRFPASPGWSRVFDFGCGIGTDALFLASRGYEVTLVDVDSPTFRFARHRFERRGIKARFIESNSSLPDPDGKYAVVLCFDVFEHLPEPLEAAKRLVNALQQGGLLVQQGSFGDEGAHPCHLPEGISKFGGLKWHIGLARLGLRNMSSMIYRKATPPERLGQWIRYSIWKATGYWLTHVPR